MNIQFHRIRRSYYLSLLFLLILIASLFIQYPFKSMIMPAFGLLLVITWIYQMTENLRIGKLLIRTSEILTQSNERSFPVLDESEKNIINHKISNLIEQLEDSVKQTDHILKEKDLLSREADKYRQELERMQKVLNSDVIKVKSGLRESIGKLESLLAESSSLASSCSRETEMLDEMTRLYSTYEANYSRVNQSIIQSREISEKEIDRGLSLEEQLTVLSDNQENSEDHLQSIFKGIDSIREITDIINNVAEKASILSLNAAIESAHAGEAGKGFAVVAEEVGVLADTTAEHAEFINESLFSVTDLIKDSKYEEDRSEDTFGQLSTGLKQMIQAFQTIKELLKELSLIEKPENFAIREENRKNSGAIEKNQMALRNLKNELDHHLEKIGQIPLLKEQEEAEETTEEIQKFTIHETAVKTVRDEDQEEEVHN